MTLCSYNFWNGIGNDCKTDQQIAVGADGYYTIVLSEEKDRPKMATAEHGVTWLNSGRFLDGSLNYRMLFEDDALLQGMQEVLDGGTPSPEVAPYVPSFAHCPKGIYNQGGWQGCFEWNDRKFD